MDGLLQIDFLTNNVISQVMSQVHRTDNRTSDRQEVEDNKAQFSAVTRLLGDTLKSLDAYTASDKPTAKGNPQSNSTSASDIGISQSTSNEETIFSQSEKLDTLNAQTAGVQESSHVYPESIVTNQHTAKKTGVDTRSAIKDAFSTLSGSSPKSLATPAKTLETMAAACVPIKKLFEDLLTQPYIGEHNALLNTAPIVGLSGRNIKYVNINSLTVDGKTKLLEEWALFDEIPKDADTSNGAVHMFAYNGQFYLSVGKSLWKKEARNRTDQALKNARNSWPQLFEDDWKKIGDDCLPAANLRSISAHAEGYDPAQPMRFYLLIVDSNGMMKVCSDTDLTANNKFDSIRFTESPGISSSPKWTRLAYYANKIFAIDEKDNYWNIKIAEGAGSFSVVDQKQQKAVCGLTANDTGVVAARSDGFLWRHIAGIPLDEKDKASGNDGWIKWMSYGDITHIGVASPGVFLDLKTLTAALRDQYMQTQTAIRPVVSKIRSFANVHHTYLGLMKEASIKCDKAEDEETRQAIKTRAARQTWRHITMWAKKLQQASTMSQATVANMTAGLKGVSHDLRAQAKAMKTRIEQLQKVLEGQEEELRSIKSVELWSLIVACVCAIAFFAACAFGFGWLALGAGVVFIGGFMVAMYHGSKEDAIRLKIAETKTQIESLQKTFNELESLATSFEGIEDLYKHLNSFWGKMADTSRELAEDNDPNLQEILVEELDLLWDSPEFETATASTLQLKNGADAYLGLLHAQGIYIPTGSDDVPEAAQPMMQSLATAQKLTAETTYSVVANHISELSPVPNMVVMDADGEESESIAPAQAFQIKSQSNPDPTESNLHSNDVQSAADTSDSTSTVEVIVSIVPSARDLFLESAYNKNIDHFFLRNGNLDGYFECLDLSSTILKVPQRFQHTMLARSGQWFDIGAVRNNLSMWYDTGLLRLLQFSNIDMNQLNNDVRKAQGCVIVVAQSAVKLGSIMDDWSKQLRSAGSQDERQIISEGCAGPAMIACQEGQESIARLNNTFNSINHLATDAQLKVVTEIKKLQEEINAIDFKFWGELGELQNKVPFFVRLGGSSIQWAEWQSQRLEAERDTTVNRVQVRIVELNALINSGHSFKNQALTWKEVVETISTILGQVHVSLMTISDELEIDPDMYAENILNVEWPALITNGTSVLDVLGVGPSQWTSVIRTQQTESIVQTFSIQSTNYSLQSQARGLAPHVVVNAAENEEEKDDAQDDEERQERRDHEARLLCAALQAQPVLGPNLRDSLEQEDIFFAKIREIQSQPHVSLVKAYDDGKKAVSLQEFCTGLVASYAFAAQRRNRALNSLKSLALMQASAVKRLRTGRKKWSGFVDEFNHRLEDPLYLSEKASDDIAASHKAYRTVSDKIVGNQKAFAAKSAELKKFIDGGSKKISDHNFQVAADGATLLVISAAAGLAIFKGPALAFKAVSGIYSGGSAIGGDQYSIRNTFKSFYSAMNWEELKESFSSWRILSDTLDVAGGNLDAIHRALDEMTASGQLLDKYVHDMRNRMKEYDDRIGDLGWDDASFGEMLREILTEERVEGLLVGWQEVAECCDLCMESFNGRGYYMRS